MLATLPRCLAMLARRNKIQKFRSRVYSLSESLRQFLCGLKIRITKFCLSYSAINVATKVSYHFLDVICGDATSTEQCGHKTVPNLQSCSTTYNRRYQTYCYSLIKNFMSQDSDNTPNSIESIVSRATLANFRRVAFPLHVTSIRFISLTFK